MNAKELMSSIKTNFIVVLGYIRVLPLIGFLLIVFAVFGFVYFQQSFKQKELTQQISNTSRILSIPLQSDERLRLQYEEINQFISSLAIDMAFQKIVNIAGESGIDVEFDSGKFLIPNYNIGKEKIGENVYKVLSFRDIKVQGEYNDVMAFITNLDSGKTLKTLVMKKVTLVQAELKDGSKESIKNEIIATMDIDIYTKSDEASVR